jgi:hypothetical protein
VPQFAAYLRVYEPLEAFDDERRGYWLRYVREGRVIATADGPSRQRATVLEALGSGWSRLPELPDEAYVLHANGGLLVCPWSLRVRVAEAALDARDGVPPVIADAFVPPLLAGLARTVVDRATDRRPHELVATWTVPLRWFVFVDPDERQLSTGRRRTLRFHTEMWRARQRAHRAVATLQGALGDAPITEAVEEGARWLEGFHPRSRLELDYGGLVDLLDDDQLAADDSPELAAAGLAALQRGDATAAVAAYERLLARWRTIQLFERAN